MSSTPLARAVARATLALAVVVTTLGALAPGAASSQERHVVYLPVLRSAGEQPPPPPPPPGQTPLSVEVTPDEARAVSAAVGPEGGQLSATGADGTLYTLSVPQGALAYTQTLSLTPSASVAGLPLSGGGLGAVQLAPEGLLLMQPATLTIAPASSDGAEVYAFGFDGAGAEFHLRRGEADAPQGAGLAGVKIITIRAPRLRGYGAGKGTQADVAQYRGKHRPARVADQIAEDDLLVPLVDYDYFSRERQKEMSVILALLDEAAGRPQAIEEAVMAYLEWDHLLSRASAAWRSGLAPERAAFKERLRQAVKAASTGAAERCRNKHSLADGLRLQRWLYYLYTYALPMDPSYLEGLVMECLSFDLEVTANFVRTGSPGGVVELTIDARVESRIPLKPRLNYPQFSLTGQGDLIVNHISYTNNDEECWEQFTPTTAHPMRVIDVSIMPDGDDFKVDSVLFDPGKGIWGTITWGCKNGGPYTSEYNYAYAAEFSMIHNNEMHGGETSGIFRLPYWRRSIADQVATTGMAYVRSKNFTDPAGTTWRVVEDTTFTLLHRP